MTNQDKEKYMLYICDVSPILDELVEQIKIESGKHLTGGMEPACILRAILDRANEAKEKADALPIHVIKASDFTKHQNGSHTGSHLLDRILGNWGSQELQTP